MSVETLQANPFEFNEDDITILDSFGVMYGFLFCLPPYKNIMKNPFYFINDDADEAKYQKLLSALNYAGYFINLHEIKKKKCLEIKKEISGDF